MPKISPATGYLASFPRDIADDVIRRAACLFQQIGSQSETENFSSYSAVSHLRLEESWTFSIMPGTCSLQIISQPISPAPPPLANPWAITRAPSNFGQFRNAVLIGNVEDGKINAFSDSGEFLGPLTHADNTPLVIPGLWDFDFAGPGPHLYFTAGPAVADFCGNGLFGFISPARR